MRESAIFKKILLAGVYVLLPVVIFVLSRNEITSVFNLHVTLGLLLVSIVYGVIGKYTGYSQVLMGLLLTSLLLYLVAATGWFFSPFFFTLYLLCIGLCFLFDISISVLFTVMLVMLFSLNIGEVDLAYDFMVVLSLLTVIPVSFYLRKYFLEIKQREKEIMILRTSTKKMDSKVEELLANKMNKFSADLRQPINDIKQHAYRIKTMKNHADEAKYQDRIIASSEEAIQMLDEFENQSTGSTVMKNTRNGIVTSAKPKSNTLDEKPAPQTAQAPGA